MNNRTEMQKKNETTPARPEPRAVLRPRVDVFENDAEYLVVADLPGVSKDALDIRFEDGELRIRGSRSLREGAQALALESRAVDYERAFAMPDGIEGDQIGAELSAGVLRVRLPKAAQKRSRKIDVRAG
jgi:HSP20 family protein